MTGGAIKEELESARGTHPHLEGGGRPKCTNSLATAEKQQETKQFKLPQIKAKSQGG